MRRPKVIESSNVDAVADMAEVVELVRSLDKKCYYHGAGTVSLSASLSARCKPSSLSVNCHVCCKSLSCERLHGTKSLILTIPS
jgi:hypothetical protein